MTTMQDVADHAGVSVMTVSNVVNDRPHVRASTRDRVLASIATLGYHVNSTARSLRQGRTGVIGLAVPDVDQPYFAFVARLFIERAARAGYEVVIEQTGAAREGELGVLMHSRLRSYDGLIMSAVGLAASDSVLFRAEYPVVLLGERAYAQPVDHVMMANEEGGALAAEHLIETGARTLAMLGGQSVAIQGEGAGSQRAAGFVAAAAAAGVAVDPALIRDAPYSIEGGYATTMAMLDEGLSFDGVFCGNDSLAFGVLRALHEREISVPGGVRVVGFDDVPLAAFMTPSLTTVAPDHVGMVDTAVQLLTDRIAGVREPDDYRQFVGAVRIVKRESTRISSSCIVTNG